MLTLPDQKTLRCPSCREPVHDVLLTPDDAGEVIGVATKTLQGWRRIGGGPKYLRLGRRPYYRLSDIAVWLGEQTRWSSTAEETNVARGWTQLDLMSRVQR